MSTHKSRPRYCLDSLVENYLEVAAAGGNLRMIKQIKALQSLVANIGTIIVAVIAIWSGADATWIGGAAIVTLGLLNGVLAVDYAAVARAVLELSDAAGTDNSDN